MRPRLARLTDALIEGILDRDLFTERKDALLLEEKGLQEKIANLLNPDRDGLARVEEFLELLKSAKQSYEMAIGEQKRRLVKKLTSNLSATHKNVDVELTPEALLFANRSRITSSAPHTGARRTLGAILDQLLLRFSANTPAEN